MKIVLASFAFGILVLGTSCDVTPCTSPYTGDWANSSTGVSLDFMEDCEVDFYGTGGCASSGTYAAPLASSGSLDITIDNSSGGACLPIGQYQCNYTASKDTLSIDCGSGGGPIDYQRP
jgi:hypothetical protein